MAKQGQHNNDANDPDKSKGRNNPDKSVDMTAGTPKNQETYQQQAANHEDTSERNARGGGGDDATWDSDTRESPDTSRETRARDSDLDSGRSGSESNASM